MGRLAARRRAGAALLSWRPLYRPTDALNYLNAADIFAERGLGNMMHGMRIAMVAPLALSSRTCGRYLLMLQFLAAWLGRIWLI